jgi:hypothetical protein
MHPETTQIPIDEEKRRLRGLSNSAFLFFDTKTFVSSITILRNNVEYNSGKIQKPSGTGKSHPAAIGKRVPGK